MALRLYHSPTTDPYLNLAIEDWLFRGLAADTSAILLWRNGPTVVIGRYQNPWLECQVEQMAADGVALARRQSGGGAVFHDLGNTNFTFLSSRDSYDQDANFAVVIAALQRLGVRAERTPRNDIVVAGRKISGNAFRHLRDRSFHHGTILLDADLDRLTTYLTPAVEALEAKGIQSVRSQVANVREYAPAAGHDRLVASFAEVVGARAEELDTAALSATTEIEASRALLCGWDWLYGHTPDFVVEVPMGSSQQRVRVTVHAGLIAAVEPDVAPDLVGRRYAATVVKQKLDSRRNSNYTATKEQEK